MAAHLFQQVMQGPVLMILGLEALPSFGSVVCDWPQAELCRHSHKHLLVHKVLVGPQAHSVTCTAALRLTPEDCCCHWMTCNWCSFNSAAAAASNFS